MPIMQFVSNLGYVAVCILGGWLATQGRISIGDIQAFLQYVRQFTQPIGQLANILIFCSSTAAASSGCLSFWQKKRKSPKCRLFISADESKPETDTLVNIKEVYSLLMSTLATSRQAHNP